jgi:hypothetical protein
MKESTAMTGRIEYALLIQWDDNDAEYVAAKDADHAEHLATTLYAHRPTWTVGREIQPWRYVRRGDNELTEVVA